MSAREADAALEAALHAREHDETLKTGEVAERAGVSLHTVRYYEGQGLLQEPSRTPAGYPEIREKTKDR